MSTASPPGPGPGPGSSPESSCSGSSDSESSGSDSGSSDSGSGFSPPRSVPRSAEVVIVGGGVMGASIAFHLAEAGVRDLVVVERGELGRGSSGKPIGGVRAHFSDPLNIELGRRSLRAYADFPRRPGARIGLETVGYLFLLTSERQTEEFAAGVRTQNELGVPSRMIGPDEARELCPYVRADGLVAAVHSPTDGHARPALVVRGYADAAARAGVRFLTHTEVTGFDTAGGSAAGSPVARSPAGGRVGPVSPVSRVSRVTGVRADRGRVTGVRTDRGRIGCSAVVCAAGAWSGRLGALAGVELPVRPVRRQLAFTAPLRPPAPRIPFTIDFASTAYFHNSDDGLLFGLADPREPEGFDTAWTPEWLELFRAAMRERAPALADMATTAGGWAGLYEVTPDHNALIGRAEDPANFLYATGFSGHGFLQAPAVGELVRDLYLGRESFADISPFRADRFTAGAGPRPEAHVV